MLLIPAAEAMIDSQGWRTALRGLAAIAAVGFGVAVMMLVRPPKRPPQPAGPQTTRDLVTERRFVQLFVATTLMSVALFSAFAFIVPFAEDNGVTSRTAALLFSLVGLSSIFGRLALTRLADSLGALRLMQLTMALQPIAYALWLFANGSTGVLAAFSLVLGVTYGGFVAISPEVAIVLFGLENVGRLMGLLFLSFGIGGLIGPPTSGWLADQQGQDTVIVGVMVVTVVALVAISFVQPPTPDDEVAV